MVYSENDNPEFQLAWELVNQTGCSLFLSGKAGTGKTTFLQKVRSECTKNLVVLAPTGVAAIHAGGSTIHSFFQLPLAPFLPGGGHGFQLHGDFSDSHSLFRNIRFNQNKKALIESLELMIIDEVSMLRSDTLDAMDWVLRTFRKNPLPFGGVQCVFIGDLYQLPPVLKDQEKNLLSTHYLSPFFFDAHALRQHPIQYIELKKIYRQTDSQFVELLNKVRHQSLSEADFQTLNQLYQPEHAEKAVDAITLCTHNFRADIINQSELKKLQAPSFRYSAAVEGDFNSRQYPTEEHLELKCGAKVMFIKNDPQNKKRFFNGKIGTITRLENERIFVQFQDADTELEVEKMNWEQIHYHLNPETRQIEEKVTGRFTQFPLRLAWAITIHKSQGLTFDNAIIDAGQSFAPGQVYVALSRCRTLSGIRLRSQILPQSLHTEIRIQSLPFREHLAGEMQHFLQVERFKYQQHRFEKLFRFQDLHQALKTAREIANSTTSHEAQTQLHTLQQSLQDLTRLRERALKETEPLFEGAGWNMQHAPLLKRLSEMVTYFVHELETQIGTGISRMLETVPGRLKKLRNQMQECDLIYSALLKALEQAAWGTQHLCKGLRMVSPQAAEKKSKKIEKGRSARESLLYFRAGKPVEEIARIREMKPSTIETHLAQYVLSGELDVYHLMAEEDVEWLENYLHDKTKQSLKSIRESIGGRYSYAQIRFVLNHILHKAIIPTA